MLSGARVVLGVCGSIAAFKAVDLSSKLTQAGAMVDVVMTRAAMEFVTPLSFKSLTHRPVVTETFDPQSEYSVEHVILGEKADIVVIAPATANTIAKLAAGIADDMLGCTVLATKAPIVIAPAMNVLMYQNPVTQENLAKLKSRGFTTVGPAHGRLATGLVGQGRLAELEDIIGIVRLVLGRQRGNLAGRKIVVTAGGTQEPLDPVRHIGNRSSGKMGYALAEAARDHGADVVLISAPTALTAAFGVKTINVRTALEMRDAVLSEVAVAEVLIMAAAVADYRPQNKSEQKIKKGEGVLTVELVRNPDILKEADGNLIKVGFAAESQDLLKNAQAKAEQKGLAFVVANDITASDSGFDVDTNKVTIIDSSGRAEDLPLMSKTELAHDILDRIANLLPH